MYVDRIRLKNFRNYTDLEIFPQEGTDIFYGANAQGKTNILEAVYLCCLGRSHRTNNYQDMIQTKKSAAVAEVRVQRNDGPRTVTVSLARNGQKQIEVSGTPIAKMADLMGHIHCVMFSPEDLQLVKGGPSLRRRYMDITLCQIYPMYYQALSSYNTALSQRGALFRKMKYGKNYHDVIDIFDDRLATYGARIIAMRHTFLQQLKAPLLAAQKSIAQHESIVLEYKTVSQNTEEAQLKLALQQALLAAREDDIKRAVTSIGPHRDDIVIDIDGKDSRVFASQGQQRTAALSLKLALIDIIYQQTGETPILMLDDVLSELDETRQQSLLAGLGGQTFITTATAPPDNINIADIFYVENGTVSLMK